MDDDEKGPWNSGDDEEKGPWNSSSTATATAPSSDADIDEYLKHPAATSTENEPTPAESISELAHRKSKEQAGKSTWDRLKDAVNPFETLGGGGLSDLSEGLGAASESLRRKGEATHMEDLGATAQGKPEPTHFIKPSDYDLASRVTGLASGVTSPTSVAQIGAAAVAPEVMLPYFAYQGGKMAYDPAKKLVEGIQSGQHPDEILSPDEIEQGLTGLSMATGAAGELGKGVSAAGGPVKYAKDSLTGRLLDKGLRGTPITDAGRIEAALKSILEVKQPGMNETDYQQRVNNAVLDLQDIAKRNAGKITTPREARDAVNERIGQIENPIGEQMKNADFEIHPDQYLKPISDSIDAALNKQAGTLSPAEKAAAKAKVMEWIGERPKSPEEIEGNRRRLNDDANAYYKSDTAGKQSIDVSDATAIAKRAAADAIRDALYGDGTNPGILERAGISATDANGQPMSLRDVRKRVGNLLSIRDHFEDAITKAERQGDWSAFGSLQKGPSLAAGGIGAILGLVSGHPIGGLLAGEAAKAIGDYKASKNVNVATKKAFRNLESTAPKNPLSPITINRNTVPRDYPFPIGPQQSQFANPIGPEQAAPPFPISGGNQPNISSLWDKDQTFKQVGAPPELGFGESYTPPEKPLGPIQGEQMPLNLPGAHHELFNLPQTPKVGERSYMPEGVKGMLPPPRATELPMPGTAELAHPSMFPQGAGSAAAEPQVYRTPKGKPGAGRMAKGFTSEPVERTVGQTAEGGPIKESEAAKIREKIGDEGEKVGGKGREGLIKPINTTAAEDLKVGDTFVDEKGDPRRITDIGEDGKIKTADHTLRDYEEGEIKHIGEINSPKAQLARGGMFHPGPEEATGEVKPMAKPKGKAAPKGSSISEIYDSDEGKGWKEFYVRDADKLPKAHMIVSPEGDALAVRLVRTMEGSEGQGFGTAAYNEAMKYAKANGFKRLVSDPEGGTKPGAAAIWKKLGAEQTGTKAKPSFSIDLGATEKPAAGGTLAKGQSTYDKFYNKETNTWDPERQKLHDKVITDALKDKKPPEGREPEAIITVGGTAAGKTTLTRQMLGDDPNRVNIDSDANKLGIPEYKGLQKSNPKKAAALVHDESKAISKSVIKAATDRGLDFMYDTSTGGGGEKLFKNLKDLGYTVKVIYADIPTEEAVDRSNKRAKESTDPINRGRFIDPDVVRKKHVEAARAFRTFMDSPHVDEIRAFDTTTREPKEFFRRGGSGEKVHDEKIMDRVKEKANERIEHPAAKK
jgi:hypothetical protein